MRWDYEPVDGDVVGVLRRNPRISFLALASRDMTVPIGIEHSLRFPSTTSLPHRKGGGLPDSEVEGCRWRFAQVLESKRFLRIDSGEYWSRTAKSGRSSSESSEIQEVALGPVREFMNVLRNMRDTSRRESWCRLEMSGSFERPSDKFPASRSSASWSFVAPASAPDCRPNQKTGIARSSNPGSLSIPL